MFGLKVIVVLLGGAVCLPTNEFESFIDNAELSMDAENPFSKLKGIVPSGYSPHKNNNNIEKPTEFPDFFDKNSVEYAAFDYYIKNGHTKKGLTFNIYDDNHRAAAIALFRLLQSIQSKIDDKKLHTISLWAKHNVNNDMYDYVWRLASLRGINVGPLSPPFITKPNYFVNSETIFKAAKLRNNDGHFHPADAEVNQYYKTDDTIFINTNYSGWNAHEKGCRELNYFREDIGFNSYAYGLSLLLPFWMSNTELELKNPGLIESVYYKLHYMYARYFLEFKHTGDEDIMPTSCFEQYDPNLVYDNGLRFPVRPPFEFSWTKGKAMLTSLDISMKELLRRGFIIKDNEYNRINITDNNHLDLIVKLIRANIAGIQASKVSMAMLGYNAQENITDKYNPAPSVAHHPMTQMRDSEFLDKIILNILNYVIEYKYTLPPLDLETYETDEVKIVDSTIPDLTTTFAYYSFDIGNAINDDENVVKSPLVLAARQRRLTHIPFQFDFSVQSKKDNDVAVRLFLGPQCSGNDCWMDFPKFFELDAFSTRLKEGMNNLTWSPKTSNRYSNDDYYNLENKSEKDKYSMYKFPESLLIPRGQEKGLILSLLVMITPIDKTFEDDYIPDSDLHESPCSDIDDKPLGFPFHKQAVGFNSSASNYRLFNVTIFHKNNAVKALSCPARFDYFSKNLY